MRSMKTFLFLAAAPLLFMPPDSKASEWNQLTRLDINETIRVPGAVLKPGNYVVKLADSPANRHIVRFMNEDQSKVIATILAVPNQRMEPTGDTQLSFYEVPAGEPPALRAWFYPGDIFGQEFVYPEKEARQIAPTAKRHVPAMSDAESTKLQSQNADADSEAPDVLVKETRIYMWSPDNEKVESAAGSEENEKMDSKSKQKNAKRYGKFESMEEGSGTRSREKKK